MTSNTNSIQITIQEGISKNYINGFKDAFGGTIDDNSLEVNTGPVKLNMAFYNIEGVEFMFTELYSLKPLIITREPDKDPELLHLNIIKEGHFAHKYKDELTQMKAGSLRGVFLYNGLFPIEVELPAKTTIKWMGFKFNTQNLGEIYDDLPKLFDKLFEEKVGLGYHTSLSAENERLLSDLFSFKDLPNGKVPLISARALEIFTNMGLHFNKEVEKDELSGLHVQDYQIISDVKTKILSNLEQSFTIDELSKEFGVSHTKLKQDFKHLFGNSIYQFYNHARMDEAYRRLKTGQFSVSEVGYDLGYSSLSKFSSMFKKIKGVLPTQVAKGN
ncbi:helix-turn-helix domain-containing protein [Carboxylicivirga sp. RSCT41]|uniref:helix-turn-helix domain-containing protein n=1 Tax=Carboxylicivirga agarovorans TaxID=3417570 RepID=UPI003D330186